MLAARIAGAADTLVAVMDAHRGEVYVGTYDGAARPRGEPVTAGARRRVREPSPPAPRSSATAPSATASAIERAVRGPVFPARSAFLAGTLGRIAEPLLAAGRGVTASELRPLYLRGTGAAQPAAR